MGLLPFANQWVGSLFRYTGARHVLEFSSWVLPHDSKSWSWLPHGFDGYPKPYYCHVSSDPASRVLKIFMAILAINQTVWDRCGEGGSRAKPSQRLGAH